MNIIYQSEAAECALACVAMVVNQDGHPLDLTTLRNRLSISLKGATLQQLMLLANQLGLASRALKLELADLNKLQTPCILHWEMNHFMLLNKVILNANTISLRKSESTIWLRAAQSHYLMYTVFFSMYPKLSDFATLLSDFVNF